MAAVLTGLGILHPGPVAGNSTLLLPPSLAHRHRETVKIYPSCGENITHCRRREASYPCAPQQPVAQWNLTFSRVHETRSGRGSRTSPKRAVGVAPRAARGVVR